MYNRKIRSIAVLLIMAMLMAFAPFQTGALVYTSHGSDVVDVGVELDYDTLRTQTYSYVVNPAWNGSLTAGASLTYSFRGQNYTETYDAGRHFSTFSAAYTYFENRFKSGTSLNRAFARVTPVFILAPGTYTESRLTVHGNAIILGSNAGVSPNASLNLDTADPTAGWAAATRYAETTVNNGFSFSLRSGTSTTNKRYETVMVSNDITQLTCVIDGVNYNAGGNFLLLSEVSGGAERENFMSIQNSVVSLTGTGYTVNDDQCYNGLNRIEFKNVRMDGTKTGGLVTGRTYRVATDGLYFANSSGSLFGGYYSRPTFTCNLQNSYFYKLTAGYPFDFSYTSGVNRSLFLTVNGNIFYEVGAASYGSLLFRTSPNYQGSENSVTLLHNTFLADRSVNTNERYTLMNGNTGDYQKGAYYLYMRYNRVIGYDSMFPNMDDWNDRCTGDANYNYFAPEYHGYSDVLGTRSTYYANYGTSNKEVEGAPYCDPFRIENLIYFEDYALTVYEGSTDVWGVSFYDQCDFVNIDNENNRITAGLTTGGTISNPQLIFKDPATTGNFYSNSACTSQITSVSPPSAGGTRTVYAKCTHGSVSKVMTVVFYGSNDSAAATPFVSTYSDPAGIISSSAYLLAPSVSSLSDGATYTATWQGKQYTFTVGTNAFSTLAKIFTAAGNSAPQIIVPYGSYGVMNLTAACSVYGENYRYPAAIGTGVYSWTAAPGWSSGSTLFTNVMIGAPGITVSGVEITGAVNDTSRTSAGTVTFRNCIVNGSNATAANYSQFKITNSSAASAGNSYVLEGLRIKNIKTDSTTGSKILFGGSLPSTVSISGCLFENCTRLFGAVWNDALLNSTCSVSINCCRFENVTLGESLFTDVRGAGSIGGGLTLSLTENVIICNDDADGALMTLSPNAYNTFTVSENIFVNSAQSGRVFDVDYRNAAFSSSGVNFTRNRIIGFADGFGALNRNGSVIDASNNYCASYTDDFTTLSDGAGPSGIAYCSRCYADYELTTLTYPIPVSFTDKGGLTFNEASGVLELTLPMNAAALDFLDGYVVIPSGATMTASYFDSGDEVAISSIAITGNTTTVKLHATLNGNPFIYSDYTLKIYRDIPDALLIRYVTSDKGFVSIDPITGGYILSLPEHAAEANIDVSVAYGSSWVLMKGTTAATSITGIEPGQSSDYVIRVSSLTQSIDYDLTVVRAAVSGVTLDYDALLNTAYIINPAWSSVSSGSVSFRFRGQNRTQTYDSSRHFASYDAAYAAWLATSPDIIHDTPVFIFAPGTYGQITVNYRAVLLGTNAGINPNDPAADVSAFTPNDDVAQNTAWNTSYETVFSGGIVRTTRVSGNDVLTLERTVQTAEAGSGESMSFYLVADGITLTGAATAMQTQDIDVGAHTDTANSISLTVSGNRVNEMILQNVRSYDQTGFVYSADDDSFNHNSLTVRNVRFTGYNGSALIQKYVDTLIFDGCYMTGCTLSNSILDVFEDMQPRRNINYVFKNNCFKNNNFARTVRIRTTPLETGSYSSGVLEFYNNAFIETSSSNWGVLSFSAAVPNLTVNVHDNLFSQTGSYNNVALYTVIEGNEEFFVGLMTMNVNRNRVIGARTILPNYQNITAENTAKLSLDFNANYLAAAFTSADDAIGVQPTYYAYSGATDAIHPETLSYYHDWALTVLNTDFDVTNVTFGSEPAEFTYDAVGEAYTVALPSAVNAPLTFTAAGAGVTATLLKNNAAVSTVSYNEVNAGATDYALRLQKNGVTVTRSVTVLSQSVPYFAEAYSDPTGEIQNTAFIVASSVGTAASGSAVYLEWRGTMYRFISGVNAFSCTDDILSNSCQVLIPAGEHGAVNVYGGMSVYGVNYDVDPNVKGSDISDDWAKNSAWGAYGESCVAALDVTANAAGKTVLMKGLTLRGRFYDMQRGLSNTPTRVTLENTVVAHTEWQGSSPYGNVSDWYALNFSNKNTREGSGSRDVGIIRNMRIESVKVNSDTSNTRNRLLNEYLPADFTMDGVYIDCTTAGVNLFGWWKISPNQQNGSINILGCNFRRVMNNSVYLYFEGRNHVNNADGQTLELNLRDNCFYNMQGSSGAAFTMSLFAYSKINIVGNLFLNTTSRTNTYIGMADTGTANGILVTNLYRNRFIGTRNYYNNPSKNSKVDISGNYYRAYSSNYKTDTSNTGLTGNNYTRNWYYTNYALTTRSDSLNYSFTPDIIQNNTAKTLTLNIGAGMPTVSLYDYIASDGGCTFTIDGVSDNTAIPSASTTGYTLTVTKGSASETWTFTVNVIPVDLTALYAALDRAAGTDTSSYRAFAVTRINDAVAAGKPLIHDVHVTAESAALAAQRINLALDVGARIIELEALIASAQAVDTSLADEEDVFVLSAAITSAQNATNNPEVSLEMLNNEYSSLSSAMLGISFGLYAFRQDIARANALLDDPYVTYNTSRTRIALVNARNAAQRALDGFGTTVTVESARSAWNTLVQAIDRLAPDTAQLNNAISHAQAIDTAGYCTPGVTALESEIAAASAATITVAADVANWIFRLQTAESALTTHNMSEYVYNNDATCTADGTETASCTNTGCTHSDTRVKSGTMTAHDYAPAYNENGHFERCTGCGAIRNEAAHSFDDDYDTTCSGCAFVRTGAANAINPIKLGDDSLTANDVIDLNVGLLSEIDLTAILVNPYGDGVKLYGDEDMELEITDLTAVEIADRGSTFWMKVSSPDGSVNKTVIINAIVDSVLTVDADKADDPLASGAKIQLSWRGYVRAHGNYTIEIDDFSGAGFSDGDRRVGILLTSTLDSSLIEAAKASITAAAETGLDDGLASFNASSTYLRAYAMAGDRQLYWNDLYGAWTYRYNFNVAEGKTRSVIAFVVYNDNHGDTRVAFSELSTQVATVG